jgi:hypothetical protein
VKLQLALNDAAADFFNALTVDEKMVIGEINRAIERLRQRPSPSAGVSQ